MRAEIDTCIELDALQNREPFCRDAQAIFLLCANRQYEGFLTAKSVTDIYYLTHRQGIRYVFLLVDIRHEPGTLDMTMLEWVRHHGYQPVIIATKADKLSKAQQQKQLSVLRRSMSLTSEDRIIPFSALSKQGRDEIWTLLEEE